MVFVRNVLIDTGAIDDLMKIELEQAAWNVYSVRKAAPLEFSGFSNVYHYRVGLQALVSFSHGALRYCRFCFGDQIGGVN